MKQIGAAPGVCDRAFRSSTPGPSPVCAVSWRHSAKAPFWRATESPSKSIPPSRPAFSLDQIPPNALPRLPQLMTTATQEWAHEFDAPRIGCYHDNAGWSSLVARWAHNPKVGGSNPPPATNAIIGLQAKLLFPAGAKRGIQGCFGGLFHFASFRAGRSAICTTLLLAVRFDSIMASP
jgi:hypothetical protein